MQKHECLRRLASSEGFVVLPPETPCLDAPERLRPVSRLLLAPSAWGGSRRGWWTLLGCTGVDVAWNASQRAFLLPQTPAVSSSLSGPFQAFAQDLDKVTLSGRGGIKSVVPVLQCFPTRSLQQFRLAQH